MSYRMDKKKAIFIIEEALKALDLTVQNSSYLSYNNEPICNTKKVSLLLKTEINEKSIAINERILRAMHDIGMSSFKEYENTPLENAIVNLTTFLYNEIPNYKFLTPLGAEYGKGNPI
jgi:hypothetical protein